MSSLLYLVQLKNIGKNRNFLQVFIFFFFQNQEFAFEQLLILISLLKISYLLHWIIFLIIKHLLYMNQKLIES